ncbi:hypothetical protein P170DRAFT_446152 [Aspergillus steynii IBT 23096]|uniref:TAFII55 protein conserved region domain-containing protein n=1 Tax=Aspergillus steynii IBT 23096 TaxID=1392250 RepID=A0A2I2GDK2_9EURO|nr:uncharacterized protein P170DRAFT_446152 [Aspergillus steynii IBT 23096]PLB50979.1 hypothetical protein P170DRAFT_446152 [Aspergillus steynii IBT 23096]
MSEGRPALKLTFGKKKAPEEAAQPATPSTAAAPSTPAPAPSTAASDTPQRKLTLKIARKPAEGAEEEKPKKKKPSKKRPAEGPAVKEAQQQAGPKRLKLTASKKPGVQSIRIKHKSLKPTRPVGVGYDSEASDGETDPAIEEQFILRMPPGDDCDYLQKLIKEQGFNKSDFSFKPLTRDGRRAVIKVRDQQYAASLVDLPSIVEGMKSWDRRGWYKSADICQMLLVLGPIANDAEAMDYPLPSEIEHVEGKNLQYPHGLTPPLRWVRKRRFRERTSTRTIEQVEKEVEDLIALDDASASAVRYELIDSASLNRAEGLVQTGDYDDYDEYDDEQDAEGELEEAMEAAPPSFEDLEDTLVAEMEAALAAGADGETAVAAAAEAVAPGSDGGVYQAGTPMATKPSTPAAESSEDDSDVSDGEEADVPEDEMDEEQLERQRQMQQQREEITELETMIRTETAKWEKTQNHILRGKLAKRIQDLKRDLSLKKVSVGDGDDGDD